MIQTKRLIKTIGDKMILKGVDTSVQKGEAVAILGPNGAGKSTYLKVVAGLMKPNEGEVCINEKPIKKDHYDEQRMIGYLGHQSFLYDHLSPIENLRFYSKLYQIENMDEKVDELIDEVGLTLFKHEPVRSFSRGMVQRLAIARAILHDPSVLLLDEPHTGLDQQAIHILNSVLERLKLNEVTIMMATHDFPQVIESCDRIFILRKGRLVKDSPIVDHHLAWLHDCYDEQVSLS
ncbi:heme ABC exporter ATP-binding protein CcmA [Bacillus shivajii]|uniref:heme ABC exporter ATP-binding protein CcmA n=1 Tax=Bacillus shivajii TaxID=1983719 RepID=UPI001CFA0EDB|nr:heme ABC exporter ATP-binding protein CcmA [Bacillus shivajii]UCZ52497.1 heme ABC exporter ATP-binding protein CcmA [Bacillus shivajii]